MSSEYDHEPGVLDRLVWNIQSAFRRWWCNLVTLRLRRRWDREAKPLRSRATELIPKNTPYCYTSVEDPGNFPGFYRIRCPFWYGVPGFNEGEYGYCSLVRIGDWQTGCGLLWDECKVCGIGHRKVEVQS